MNILRIIEVSFLTTKEDNYKCKSGKARINPVHRIRGRDTCVNWWFLVYIIGDKRYIYIFIWEGMHTYIYFLAVYERT